MMMHSRGGVGDGGAGRRCSETRRDDSNESATTTGHWERRCPSGRTLALAVCLLCSLPSPHLPIPSAVVVAVCLLPLRVSVSDRVWVSSRARGWLLLLFLSQTPARPARPNGRRADSRQTDDDGTASHTHAHRASRCNQRTSNTRHTHTRRATPARAHTHTLDVGRVRHRERGRVAAVEIRPFLVSLCRSRRSRRHHDAQ